MQAIKSNNGNGLAHGMALVEGRTMQGGRWSSRQYKTAGDERSPLITIITVVFNAAPLLEETIRSVTRLEYKNVEYIVIDGGSSDGTVRVLRENDSAIDYWISEPDDGIYHAMNKALKLARGDFVWFINAGDEVGSASVLTDIFRHGARHDFYFGNTQLIHADGTVGKLVLAPNRLTVKQMYRGMVVSHQSIIVKRSIAPKYDVGISLTADQKWIIDALRAAASGAYINVAFSRYRLGGLSDRRARDCVIEKYVLARRDLRGVDQLAVVAHCMLQLGRLGVKRLLERQP